MVLVPAVFALFADQTRPDHTRTPGRDIQQHSDGLDAARGVLLSAVLGLAGWLVIGALIAACTTR